MEGEGWKYRFFFFRFFSHIGTCDTFVEFYLEAR